ncbi:unnamed protein product [Phyllotreta striolata]|uniref:COMM domain-containing protein n=1 Tax=Phyllotreta striolata TaxID=444603 RepID=A0A9P0DZH3_PHYSR|nr:unnamed protein product [Phyllotreta striolata]
MGELNFDPLLKITDINELKKFIHHCVDDLIEKQPITFDTCNIRGILEWTKDDFEKSKKNIQLFYKKSTIENNFDANLLHINDKIHETLKICYEIRKDDIFQYLARTYVLKNGNNLIENIDWRIKFILGSSDLTALKDVYLQVDLNGVQKYNEKTENTSVSFEMNLEQVDELIQDLRNIRNQLS